MNQSNPTAQPVPRKLIEPPALPIGPHTAPIRGEILLVNPFYPKDPNGSFGKHVLTPSLALTSIAAATPAGWTVRFWDENLLQGSPPVEPFPEVVGITVHLTFADRAYELARWYRDRGAVVVLGGLHVTSCPDEAKHHADAIVVGEGTAVWGQILRDHRYGHLAPRYTGSFRIPRIKDQPPPRTEVLPRSSFLTTSSVIATRGCHNRCDFCYLAMSYLYKRCNWLWSFLIRHQLVAAAWRPLIHAARRRHLRLRRRLAGRHHPQIVPGGLAEERQ